MKAKVPAVDTRRRESDSFLRNGTVVFRVEMLLNDVRHILMHKAESGDEQSGNSAPEFGFCASQAVGGDNDRCVSPKRQA
jgi:hypothetical protein